MTFHLYISWWYRHSNLVFSYKLGTSKANNHKKEGLLSKYSPVFLAVSFSNNYCKCWEVTLKCSSNKTADSKNQPWEHRECRMKCRWFIGKQ